MAKKQYSKKDYREEVEGLSYMLVDGVENVLNDKGYSDFLNMMGKMPNYSARNVMLIWQQFPSATMVASYGTWKKLGRYPTEKSKIRVFAPITPKKEKNDVDEEPIGYFALAVFDVSQTDGEPLPQPPNYPTYSTLPYKKKQELLTAIKKISDYPIMYEEMKGKQGYFSEAKGKIAIKDGLDDMEELSTLIHELVHSRLHTHDCIDQNKDNQSIEVEAESIAYIVSEHFNIDTSGTSFPYIAGWSKSRTTEDVYKSLETIQKEAQKMIAEIDHQMNLGKHVVSKLIQRKERANEKLPKTKEKDYSR